MKMSKIITGVGIGMAVGSVAAITTGAMSSTSSTKRMYKRRANKAMKSMNNMMGDLHYMFK